MSRPSVYCWHHLYDHYYHTYSYTTLAMSKEDAIENVKQEIERTQTGAIKSYLLLELKLQAPDVINLDELNKVVSTEVQR